MTAPAYVSHIVIDGKRPRSDTPANPGKWACQPKHAVQLLAKGNRILKGSGLVLRDWGTETTPAGQRYYLEEDSGDDWTLIPDLPSYVAELEGAGHDKG